MKLTKEELAQIRERCEKATSEPWTYIPNENLVVKYESRRCRERIAEMVSESNGPFLAGSSTDIPKLLSHIDELERENKKLKEGER